jgi:hypothetical protein
VTKKNFSGKFEEYKRGVDCFLEKKKHCLIANRVIWLQFWEKSARNVKRSAVSQAYFALHETLHKVQSFKEKIFFGTMVTSEAFLGVSQNLKVTRLQGGTQTKLWTSWQNFDLSRSF